MTTQQPEAVLTPAVTSVARGRRSGFWRRLSASLIDALLLTICTSPLILFDITLYKLVNLAVQTVYYTVLEGGPKGQTIGKKALGIRVVGLATGEPIGYGRGLVRYVGRYLSFFVLLLGYLRMLWHSEKQTWHDQMAGAVVVRARG